MAEEEAIPTQQQFVSALGSVPVIDDGTMEEVLEKLKLLRYESEFLPRGKPPFKPLNRAYFSTQNDNPNAQFFYFTSLCSWLMEVAGHSGFPPPGQFDDPNATAATILSELRTMGVSVANLAPGRLRQGSGESVLLILALLADRALITRGFAFQPMVYPATTAGGTMVDAEEPPASLGGGNTIAADEIIDHVDVPSDDDDEEYVRVGNAATGKDKEDAYQMISPQISAERWNLEVEKVAPFLQLRSDEVKDWRARIEGATTLLKAVEKMYPDVKTMLQRMGDDLEKGRDRIQKREQTLAQQFSEHVEDYRTKLRELNTTQDSFTTLSQTVSQLTTELNQVSEQLDRTKQEIEERESKISDTTPLMQIKDAVSRIRGEIKQMSLRIGVLQHTVLHYALRQKREGAGPAVFTEESEDFHL